MDVYKKCNLCPRNCGVNRYVERGYCGATNKVMIARAALHYWEEPCLSGEEGSGTIFFSHCNLKCIFCQNEKISIKGFGREVTIEQLADICLSLEKEKANNINLVTPTHYVPSIIRAVRLARKSGLSIPIVYNTSSYENIETIKMLDGTVDIYLPDLKYFDEEISKRYSHVDDYFEVASKSIDEMIRQIGEIKFDDRGIMSRGVIVRILLLPGHVDDAKKLVKYLFERYDNKIYMSIMNQYTPMKKFIDEPLLSRKVSEKEYAELINYACDLGVVNAFMQEGGTQSDSFIPDFNLEGIN